MAFLSPIAGSAGDSSLYILIFNQFLKMQPCLSPSVKYGCITGDITHDLIFNLLLPHVLILGFIVTFIASPWMKNRGIQLLTGAVTYIVIIQLEWYGFLASTMTWWFIILLGAAIFKFMASKIYHPARFGEQAHAGYLSGLRASQKKKLMKLKHLAKELKDRENDARKKGNDEAAAKLSEQRHNIELEILKIEGGN